MKFAINFFREIYSSAVDLHFISFVFLVEFVLFIRITLWRFCVPLLFEIFAQQRAEESRREIEHLRLIENRKQIESIVSSSGTSNWHHRLKLSTCKVSAADWILFTLIVHCFPPIWMEGRHHHFHHRQVRAVPIKTASKLQLIQIDSRPRHQLNCHWRWNGEHKNTSIIDGFKRRR